MEKGLGSCYDVTAIKEVGLNSVKPSRVIQSADFAIKDINIVESRVLVNGREMLW